MKYLHTVQGRFVDRPNRFIAHVDNTHKEFGIALNEAKKEGVKILYLPCFVDCDGITILSK